MNGKCRAHLKAVSAIKSAKERRTGKDVPTDYKGHVGDRNRLKVASSQVVSLCSEARGVALV